MAWPPSINYMSLGFGSRLENVLSSRYRSQYLETIKSHHTFSWNNRVTEFPESAPRALRPKGPQVCWHNDTRGQSKCFQSLFTPMPQGQMSSVRHGFCGMYIKVHKRKINVHNRNVGMNNINYLTITNPSFPECVTWNSNQVK